MTEPAEVGKGEYVVAINGRRCVVWREEEGQALPVGRVDGPAARGDQRPGGRGRRDQTPVRPLPGGHATVAWLLDPRVVAAARRQRPADRLQGPRARHPRLAGGTERSSI
ncbi:hypothetical protein ACFQX7_37705 [Luedemannella flava]